MRINNSIKSENEDEKPKGGLLIKLCFILFGIASLLGLNSVLSNIDLFEYFQSDLKPGVTISFLNYALNLPVQVFLFLKKKSFNLKTQLIIGLIGLICCQIAIPFSIFSFEKNNIIGIILTVVIFLIMGINNALLSAGFFALASYFPLEMIISLSTGQGFSGIIMAFLELSLLFMTKGDDRETQLTKCAYIYFAASSFILISCLIVLIIGFKTDYFIYYLSPVIEPKRDSNIIGDDNNLLEIDIPGEEKDPIEQEKNELTVKEIFKKLIGVNFLIFFCLVITYMLYPYVIVNQNLFNLDEYNTIVIILLYNSCATLGRYSMSFFKPTKQMGNAIIMGRSALLLSLFLNNYLFMKLGVNIVITSILLIANVAILAFTNGISISLCIGLAPTYFSVEYKGKAGFSISLFQKTGILVGSLLSFLSKEIMNSIGIYKKTS